MELVLELKLLEDSRRGREMGLFVKSAHWTAIGNLVLLHYLLLDFRLGRCEGFTR